MNQLYIYPQNLKAQAKLWFWDLRDIIIIGVALLISVLALTQITLVFPIALTLGYAFLTIRMDDLTVLDFIIRSVKYFITTQQYYEWKQESVGTHGNLGGDSR